MVLMAGPRQIDWKILRKIVGKNRISLASKDEVLSVTGYQLGAVAPLGLRNPLKILVDNSVLREEIISLGSGIRGTAIIMKSVDLVRVLENHQIVDFCNA